MTFRYHKPVQRYFTKRCPNCGGQVRNIEQGQPKQGYPAVARCVRCGMEANRSWFERAWGKTRSRCD